MLPCKYEENTSAADTNEQIAQMSGESDDHRSSSANQRNSNLGIHDNGGRCDNAVALRNIKKLINRTKLEPFNLSSWFSGLRVVPDFVQKIALSDEIGVTDPKISTSDGAGCRDPGCPTDNKYEQCWLSGGNSTYSLASGVKIPLN